MQSGRKSWGSLGGPPKLPHKLGPKITVGTIQKDTEKARGDSQVESSLALLFRDMRQGISMTLAYKGENCFT